MHKCLSSIFAFIKTKKMKSICLTLFATIILTLSTWAQSTGVHIKYNMSYSESGLTKEELSMMPEETEMWLKGDLVKMRMPMGMGMQSDVIILKDKVVLLMDLMGNKLAMETSKTDVEKKTSKEKNASLKLVDGESKVIASYTCKKAILSTEGEKDVIIWYTDKIKSNGAWYFQMQELKGFPLEFSMKTAEISVRMTAKELNMDAVSDDEFKVPSDYKVMTQAEMMRMMGGGLK